MAAQNFNFRFTNSMPTGWTANSIVPAGQQEVFSIGRPSVVGPVNALAQNPVSAEALMTTPSTLADPTLGSRRYMNPNTGVRDVAASGSVYAQSNVPAFLSQAVSSLNAEQALRRSIQSEWNNRILAGANSGGPNAYLFQEALRAASVGPGSNVSFGAAVQNPAIGRGYETASTAQAQVNTERARQVAETARLQSELLQLQRQSERDIPGSPYANQNQARIQALQRQTAANIPVAAASASPGGGWFATPFSNPGVIPSAAGSAMVPWWLR